MQKKNLESYTIKIFLIATFFNGFISSIGNIQDIIAKKALSGLDWQVTLIAMLMPVASFFSIWWGKILEQSHNRSKFFLLMMICGRLPLVLGVFIGNIYQYVGLLGLMFSFNALWNPAQNALLQTNVNKNKRGRIFGISASISTFVAMTGSFIAGRMLDVNEDWFRYLFLVVGIGGAIAPLLLYMVPFKTKNKNVEKIEIKKLILSPIIRTVDLLKTNKAFARYELNFMIYGIGFMMMLPAIPKFLVENLSMTYTQIFIAKGVISQLGILLFAPIAGKFHDSKHPSHFTMYVFGFLTLWPFFFLISSLMNNAFLAKSMIYVSYSFFGIAMSGVVIAWNLGSIHFAQNEDASMFQSVHVSLTGLRGLIIPPIGLQLMSWFGVRAAFIASIIALSTASFLSFKAYKNE